MAISDDGDIVRGLGYVTLYAAYMEEAIEECSDLIVRWRGTTPNGYAHWPISRKVDYLKDFFSGASPLPDELKIYPRFMDYIRILLKRRNEVIHGRIYGSLQGDKSELRPGRPTGSQREISSSELYTLANRLFSTLQGLNRASMFSLPRLLRAIDADRPMQRSPEGNTQ